MGYGLPVVATASEGPSEIIANGINGLLVQKGNAEQMAVCIRQLLDEPIKFQRLSKNAFETIHDHYDISVISKVLENAINAIIG
jgi:glycosyltransferase involved in cell wall biosynthesis